MNGVQRFFITVFILVGIFSYGLYKKNEIWKLSQSADSSILKILPKFTLTDFFEKKVIDSSTLFQDHPQAPGIFVHFWATWCGPCEAELPGFLELASQLASKKVVFLLIAVNDEEVAIKKYLKKFKKLSKNIILVMDNQNVSMEKFGTVKVPETYLFSKEGILLNRFIGPQDWTFKGLFNRIVGMLKIKI